MPKRSGACIQSAAHSRHQESGDAANGQWRAAVAQTIWATNRAPISRACRKSCATNDIPFTINPRLVRGMDYYNRTVFEWVTDQLGAQGTVCAGGRYDPLVETSAESRRRPAVLRWGSNACWS